MTPDPQPVGDPSSAPGASRSARWAPLAIFVCALAVRLAYVYNVGHSLRFPDERSYWRVAENVVEGRGLILDEKLKAVRAPVYPLLLAASQKLFYDSLVPIRLAQAILGALTCVLLFYFGRSFSGPVCGIAAGAIACVYPFFVYYTGLALSETLFTAELVTVMLAMWHLLRRPRWWLAMLAGAAFGLAVLTRPSAMLLLPAALPLYFIGEPRKWRQAGRVALLLIAFAAVMSPWVWRNYRVVGEFVPTTLQVGASLYESNAPDADGGPAMDRVRWPEELEGMSEYERDRYLLRKSLECISADWPRFGRLCFHRSKRFWNLVPNYEEYRRFPYWLISVLSVGPLLVLGLIGLALRLRRGRPTVLVLLPVVYFAALHAVFVGSTRYRTPVMPMVMLFAGHALYLDDPGS